MNLTLQLIFVIIRPLFAVFLTIGAVFGVAASVIIMNLMVGYFSVAQEAYTSVHPHIVVKGTQSDEQAGKLAAKIAASDPQITMALPALHFEDTFSIASVLVLSELCDPSASLQQTCSKNRNISKVRRTYAYDVNNTKQTNVQLRGISIENGETVANYRKLVAGSLNFNRLAQTRDEGGNQLPYGFMAQDTLVGSNQSTYLISRGLLKPKFERYFRLTGLIRLGAKSSGAGLIVTGLEQAKQFVPEGSRHANVVEVRLAVPGRAEAVAKKLATTIGKDLKIETWVDKERPAFEFLNATWIMVFAVMLSSCVVVAISIYSTLTLSVMRNRWKVAVLGTLGATQSRIGRLFMYFAVSIAFVGTVLGVIIGNYASIWIGGWLYRTYLNMPGQDFARTLTLEPSIWMAVATTLIFVISAVLPAIQATRIRPSEALNNRV